MNKLIAAVLLLASTAASASSLYIDVGVSCRRGTPNPPPGYTYEYDPEETKNPYMDVALGIVSEDHQFGDVLMRHSLEIYHESSPATGRDWGINSIRYTIHAEFKL